MLSNSLFISALAMGHLILRSMFFVQALLTCHKHNKIGAPGHNDLHKVDMHE